MTAAIIVASGSSRRMGFDKLLAPLAGKPVLRHSIEAFVACPEVEALVVVCPAGRWRQLGDIGSDKPVTRVNGGATRHESVQAGLGALPRETGWVAIHDGARPLVSPADITRCIAAARADGAATLARPATDTMMRSDAQGFSAGTVDRERLWCMETPQVFRVDDLHRAALHARGHGLSFTDEVSALQAIGGRVRFIEPSRANLKVTTPSDLALAAALLKDPA